MGIRTDLAMEAKALWEKSAGKTTKLAGVRARERERDGFAVTDVHILDRRGEAALGKPAGRYVTLELPPLMREVRPAAEALAAELRRLLRLQSILQAIAEQSRIVRLPLNQVGALSKIQAEIIL